LTLETIRQKEGQAKILILRHKKTGTTTWIYAKEESALYNLDQYDTLEEVWHLLATID
jgi:hypothetical protein